MKKVTTDISSFLNVEKVKVKEAKSESSIESQINKLMKKASHEALLKHPILKEYYKRIETTTFKENKKSNTVVIYPNGIAKKSRNFGLFTVSPKIKRGGRKS